VYDKIIIIIIKHLTLKIVKRNEKSTKTTIYHGIRVGVGLPNTNVTCAIGPSVNMTLTKLLNCEKIF
jgi:hypothetical protein